MKHTACVVRLCECVACVVQGGEFILYVFTEFLNSNVNVVLLCFINYVHDIIHVICI